MVSKNILVIVGHPYKTSLSMGIADSYIKGAKGVGNEVRRINLKDIKFDPVLWELKTNKDKVENDIVKSREAVTWADHIVFIFPIWWGTMPALLKGWIDLVFVSGFAFKYVKGQKKPEKLLVGKTIELIKTSGGARWMYLIPGISDNMIWRYVIADFFGMKCKRITQFGGVRPSMGEERCKRILERVEGLGSKS